MRWFAYPVRAFTIFVVLSYSLVVYGLGRLGTFFISDKERRSAAVARLRGRVAREAMTRLGATLIKLGQTMSSRQDIFPPETIDELRQLQDKLPPFSMKKARRRVETDLGLTLEDVFQEFDEKPLAAASVAQVHRARLVSGEEVAVKVLRPNVRKQAQRDAAILRFGAKILAIHPGVRLSDPVGHLDQFVEGIIAQTDLNLEADNYRRFKENFDDFDGIVFPRVYSEQSGENVLTMELVRGTKLDELEPKRYPNIALAMNRMWLKMCFVDGFVHADLHPGNSLVTESGDVALFDVGLVMHMTDEMLLQFIDFNRCLAFGRTADYVNHLRTFHNYLEENVDWDAVTEDMDKFVVQFRGKQFADIEFTDLFNQIFALGRKHGIRPIPEYTLMIVGAMTAEGIGKMMDPDLDAFASMTEFLIPIIQERGLRPTVFTGDMPAVVG